MNCQQYQDKFQHHLDGELSLEETASLQSHLKECLPCYRKWISLHKSVEMLRQLPELEPPGHLDAVIMARLRNDRWGQRSWISPDLFRWATFGASLAVLLVFSIALWRAIPANLTWRSYLPGGSDTKIAAERLADRSAAELAVTGSNPASARPVVVLKVKDFSRADQQLASLLRSFARPTRRQQELTHSLSSSSARLFDLQVPGQRFPHLIRELHKIGHLDPEQLKSHELSSPGQHQAMSIRIVIITNGKGPDTSQRLNVEGKAFNTGAETAETKH
jgi:hypothetical protein